tara:strand:- start:549 stop:758 length:210 start_codon:yes stop_codon:yes gene_type:complete
MNIEQEIKDEIYRYVSQIELTKEELQHVDTYVSELVNFLKPVLIAQDNVINNQDSFDEIKKMILENLGA